MDWPQPTPRKATNRPSNMGHAGPSHTHHHPPCVRPLLDIKWCRSASGFACLHALVVLCVRHPLPLEFGHSHPASGCSGAPALSVWVFFRAFSLLLHLPAPCLLLCAYQMHQGLPNHPSRTRTRTSRLPVLLTGTNVKRGPRRARLCERMHIGLCPSAPEAVIRGVVEAAQGHQGHRPSRLHLWGQEGAGFRA